MKLMEVYGGELLPGDRILSGGVFRFAYSFEPVTDEHGHDFGTRAAKLDSRAAIVVQERTRYKILREV
jgi:hypothetical protein